MRKKQVIPVKAEKLNSYYEENRGLERGCIGNEIANPSLKSEIKNIKSLFKLFMITGIVAFLQMSTLTVAQENKGRIDLILYMKKIERAMHTRDHVASEQLNISEKGFEKIEKQFEEIEAIYKSIVGNRIKEAPNPLDDEEYRLEGYIRQMLPPPAKIINYILTKSAVTVPDNTTGHMHSVLRKYELTEKPQPNIPYKNDREKIFKKLQNTIAFGEHINTKAFTVANNRFEALKKLTEKVENTEDLKDNSELQAAINLLVGIIQNEAIKFQIAEDIYSNAEELINQRKHQLYTAVFNHKNTGMPSIKSVSTKF